MEWIIIGSVLFVLWVAIAIYNAIIRSSQKIHEAYANIDVALSKRYQVLSQLFEIAKGYAKYERETLLAVIQVRQGMSIPEKEAVDGEINREYDRLFALSEAYPDLKADQLFLNLQDAARDAEEHLQAARRLYNSNVVHYNMKIQTFPGLLVASLMQTKHYDLFKTQEKENVDLQF